MGIPGPSRIIEVTPQEEPIEAPEPIEEPTHVEEPEEVPA